MSDQVSWPEYEELDRSKPSSFVYEQERVRLARQANWHGLSDFVPGGDLVVRHVDARAIPRVRLRKAGG
jgi:hypothetical protein